MTLPDPDALLATALRRAAAGHPVLPCVPGTKRPLTAHGLLDAGIDPDRIGAWWARNPTANLAVPTGLASYDVLDVDLRLDGSGYPALNRLTRAGLVDGYSHVVRTPSGGLHVYFTGTGRAGTRLPAEHLDLKATGGYVLVPPSVVDGRRYELIRRTRGPHRALDWDAVRERLSPPAPPAPPTPTPIRAHPTPTGIEPLARWVARLPEGQRNAGTFWAACRAVEGGIADLRPLVEAAVTAGLPRAEAARTVRSAAHRGAARLPVSPDRARTGT